MIFLLISILYSQSGWGPEIVAVYRDSMPFYTSYMLRPQIAAFGDTLHLTWCAWIRDSANYPCDEIFYTRSLDCGNTWEPPRIISKLDSVDSQSPSICVNGNSVHVTWKEGNYSFKYRRSLDGGETWGNIETLIPAGRSRGGCISNKGDTLVIALAGLSVDSFKTWFRKSLNNGLFWSAPVLIDFKTVGFIKIGINPPYVHIVGQKYVDTLDLHEIYYIRSPDLGNTWDKDTAISEIGYDSGQWPSLYVSGSNVYVTWFDYKYTPYAWTGDIFLRISKDNGFTWEAIRETVSVSHLATQSSVCGIDHQIHIVWVEELTHYNQELYYRWASGYGFKWSSIERLTYADGWSLYPSLAYSNGKLHLVWVDERNGAVGIYYRQKSLTEVYEKFKINYDTIKFCSNFMSNYLIFELHDKKVSNIEIFDISGRKLKGDIKKADGAKYILNLRGYPSGIYFIYLNDKNKIKLIKGR